MKQTLFCIVLMFLTALICAREFSIIDLESDIYQDLERWEAAGYIDTLPKIQPYAHEIISSRLQEMLAAEDLPENLRAKAADYLDRIIGPAAKERFETGTIVNFTPHSALRLTEAGHHWNLVIPLSFQWLLHDDDSSSVWTELTLQGNVLDGGNIAALPGGSRETLDGLVLGESDNIDFFGWQLGVTLFNGSILSFSSKTETGIFSFSAGIHRSNAGPFYDDGILISSQTPAAGHFILGYEHLLGQVDDFTSRLIFTSQLTVLTATDARGQGRYSEKFLSYHNIYLDLLPWFGIGFIEAIIWGERIDLLNLIPIPGVLQFSHGISNFEGNGWAGLELLFRPVKELRIPVVLFIDDLGLNELVRFQFDTMYKFAAELGIIWSPLLPWLDQLSADYTAVMPYVYTHRNDRGEVNYSNYTHQGTNIGPGLDPNSDRWRLEWTARPLGDLLPEWFTNFQIAAGVQLIRHGNASAGVIPGGTGDLFDPGYAENGATFTPPFELPDGLPYTRFLIQDVIEHNLQFSIQVYNAFFIASAFTLSLGLEYIHEEVWNDNLQKDARKSANYLSIELGLSI